jgi:hypothetical protein
MEIRPDEEKIQQIIRDNMRPAMPCKAGTERIEICLWPEEARRLANAAADNRMSLSAYVASFVEEKKPPDGAFDHAALIREYTETDRRLDDLRNQEWEHLYPLLDAALARGDEAEARRVAISAISDVNKAFLMDRLRQSKTPEKEA